MSNSNTKPIWASRTVWGVVILLAATALRSFGIADLSPETQEEAVTWILDAVTVAGGGLALYGRVTASQRLGGV